MSAELTLLSLPGPPEGRLGETLSAALAGRAVQPYETGMDLAGRRLLFAAALPEAVVEKQPKLEGRSMQMFLAPAPAKQN